MSMSARRGFDHGLRRLCTSAYSRRRHSCGHCRSRPNLAAPTPWLLGALVGTVGLPFFAVSATAPLLQRWFALTTAKEPYFLYAASNVGSLVGLLAYPTVIERMLTTSQQQRLWTTAFAVLAAITAACAVGLRRHQSASQLQNQLIDVSQHAIRRGRAAYPTRRPRCPS